VTLYILVAGYPADRLQEAFNMLHKSKRNLRDLPQMPEQMPDSFIDLLGQLLTYRPKMRKSAGAHLVHEFITFHRRLETTGISLDDIAAEAANEASALPMMIPPPPDGSTHASLRRTHSVNLSGSVQRHNMFLNYQRYERAVTTLLATMLSKADLDVFLAKLNTHHADLEQIEVEEGSSSKDDNNVRLQKLKVIPMNELKNMLKELNQEKT
jgi:serine/threonine protein kinase